MPPEYFDRVLEHARALRLQIVNVMLVIAAERSQFAVFSKWLKIEIHLPSQSGQQDTIDRAQEVDYTRLLAYLNGPLTRSRLSVLLARLSESELDTVEPVAYDTLKNQLQSFSRVSPTPDMSVAETVKTVGSVLSIWARFRLLSGSCQAATAQVKALHLSNIHLPFALTLETTGSIAVVDSRMVAVDSESDGRMATYVAVVKDNERSKGKNGSAPSRLFKDFPSSNEDDYFFFTI